MNFIFNTMSVKFLHTYTVHYRCNCEKYRCFWTSKKLIRWICTDGNYRRKFSHCMSHSNNSRVTSNAVISAPLLSGRARGPRTSLLLSLSVSAPIWSGHSSMHALLILTCQQEVIQNMCVGSCKLTSVHWQVPVGYDVMRLFRHSQLAGNAVSAHAVHVWLNLRVH